MSVTEDLRSCVRGLFEEGRIDLFIGWERGSGAPAATPAFIEDPAEVDRLVFDATCGNNLSVFFTKDDRQYAGKRVGISVKGCDARSLVLQVVEKQVDRGNVVIVGVPCEGVVDRKKALRKTGGREVLELAESGTGFVLKGSGFEVRAEREEILSSSCLVCVHPDAREFDVFLGDPREEVRVEDRLKDVREFESLPSSDRWARMEREYGKCIRCYACRNACPSCYCKVCFVDQNDPRWIGNTCDFTDTMIFHLVRNLHVAGRCVECGACERACPMDIDLLLLNRKVAAEVEERFGDVAGMDIGGKPAMADYREDEKQDFIMG
jgi:ferredoxin